MIFVYSFFILHSDNLKNDDLMSILNPLRICWRFFSVCKIWSGVRSRNNSCVFITIERVTLSLELRRKPVD